MHPQKTRSNKDLQMMIMTQLAMLMMLLSRAFQFSHLLPKNSLLKFSLALVGLEPRRRLQQQRTLSLKCRPKSNNHFSPLMTSMLLLVLNKFVAFLLSFFSPPTPPFFFLLLLIARKFFSPHFVLSGSKRP